MISFLTYYLEKILTLTKIFGYFQIVFLGLSGLISQCSEVYSLDFSFLEIKICFIPGICSFREMYNVHLKENVYFAVVMSTILLTTHQSDQDD